jgi:hypothetical protein
MAILPLIGVWVALGAWLGREQAARSRSADRESHARVQEAT